MFTPGLAIFFLPRFSVLITCVAEELGGTLVPGRWSAVSRLLLHRYRAQGVPPGVPKSYRALAGHANVPRSN